MSLRFKYVKGKSVDYEIGVRSRLISEVSEDLGVALVKMLSIRDLSAAQFFIGELVPLS